MGNLFRRSVLRGSLGFAATAPLARPYITKAEAVTATAWFAQGFIPEEDAAFRKLVADYEKASGNKIELSLTPFAALRQKIVSALTSGVVPDLIDATPAEIIPINAWSGNLLDVTDVVETQKSHFSETALLAAQCYNSAEKRRSFYGIPYKGAVGPFHVWGSLVEKAGYKVADIPNTWDAFCDFFKPVQDKLRSLGMRHVYGLGYQLTTNGVDPNNTFHAFLIAYGGQGIVTKDGVLHSDDPKVQEAAAKALVSLTTPYKQGYVPPGAINWNDADDNNAFHARQIVMDFDFTISTELAMFHDEQAYQEMVTLAIPLSNEGKELPSQNAVAQFFIPKGAKNAEVAKDFAKFVIQPKVVGEYLKAGLGRSLPVMPSLAKDDPFWLDPKDPHVPPYTRQGLLGPTVPLYYVFNPAYGQVQTEHVWGVAMADIMKGGLAPEQATAKAFKRIEEIFAKYPIVQT
ncbi:MAG: carbohydrate ABC transporter substrate-binding protein [Acetobacteraceae bacterium]|nr:carbohydrate ABC transporter substrate-binding protein [Acetobacteraceae bacterium]